MTAMSLDMLCIADIHTATFLKVNPAFTTNLGYSEDELLTQSFMDFIHPDDINETRSVIDQQLKMGHSVINFENRYRCKDGDYRWLSWVSNPIMEQGICIAVARDISEIKQNIIALEESRSLLRSLINTLPDLVWLKNQDGVYLGCNHLFEVFFGAKESDIIGKTDYDFVDKGLADFFRKNDQKAIAANGPSVNEEELTFAETGYTGIFETIKTPLHDAHRNLVGVLGIARDINERKRAEQALLESERKWKEVVQSCPQIGVSLDNEARIIFVNDHFQNLTGYTSSEVVGRNWFDLCIPETIREEVRQVFSSTMLQKSVADFSTYANDIILKNGELRHISWSNVLTKDQSGRIIDVTCLGIDLTERQKNELDLRQSEEMFRALFEQAGGYCMILDPDTPDGIPLIIDANEAACAAHGYARGEFIGRPVADLDDEDGKRLVRKRTAEIMKGDPFYVENIHVRKDGTTFPVAVNAKRIIVGDNRPLILTTEYDITERKKVEDELRDSEFKFRMLFDKSADAHVLYNDDRFVDCNYSTLKMLGLRTKEQLIELHPGDISPPHQEDGQPSREKADAMIALAFEKGSHRFEWLCQKPDGSVVPLDILLSVIRVKGEDMIHGVWRDITEMIKAEKLIKEKQKELLALINTIQAGVVVHDVAEKRVKMFNQAALNILGLTADQILGKSTRKSGWGFIHENGDEMAPDEYPVNIVARTKEPLSDYIVGIKKPDHIEVTWSVVKAEPRLDKQNNVTEIIVSSMDITDLKKAQSQLIIKEQQVVQSQKLEAIGTLAGGIAHDFNNILTSIIGFTELALDEVEKNSSLEQSLQEVCSAGVRAKELVKQILAFARKSEEEIKPIKLQAIAEEITHLLRSSIPTSIEIITKFESNGFIMGNPSQIHQIIMNLCANAAHAMEAEGGQLTLSTTDIDFDQVPIDAQWHTPDQRFVQLQVTDTGSGISPDIIGLIFDPYFTTKSTGEGTGLGLAMVQGIVETYGGNIAVDSRPGAGTTFTVYLPLTTQNITQGEDVRPKILPTGTERILIVDDEAAIVKMCSLMLESLGYTVSSQVSSTDALELFKARPADFDLVMSDMTMPNMTGDVLTTEMMKIRNDIPVILCTGYSKRLSEESFYGLGIKALVYKPFVKADLARTVRKVLDENMTRES